MWWTDKEEYRMDLDTLTKHYSKHHTAKKNAESKLKKYKEKFNEAATKALEEKDLAQKTVVLPLDCNPTEWVAKWHPGWRVVEWLSGHHLVIREEDPAFLKFSYVNPETGLKYERNVVQAGPSLDDEALVQDHPDVWERITEMRRVLRSFDDMDDNDLAIVSKYLVPGPINPRMESPREAKSDEDE